MERQVDLIQVIRIAVKIGKGTDDDPVRDGLEYWDTEGRLLFQGEAKRKTKVTFEPMW